MSSNRCSRKIFNADTFRKSIVSHQGGLCVVTPTRCKLLSRLATKKPPPFRDVECHEAITLIVVEHKDRLTRFGFNYIETFLKMQGRQLEVVNLAENGKEDLMQDLVSIIYSFSARMYGQRRAKRKTEIIVKELQDQNDATG